MNTPTLKQGNISLILDSYSYVFSDFDPRPVNERILSDDFLYECKRAALDKFEDEMELRLLVPKHKRNIKEEEEIAKRLKAHFRKHFHELTHADKRMKRNSLFWFVCGVLMIFAATAFSELEGYWGILLLVTLEPAGWFTAWTALERIFTDAREHRANLAFYRKMSKAEIRFIDY